MTNPEKEKRLIKIEGVAKKLGVSPTTVYAYIRQGKFPEGFAVAAGTRGVFWREQDVDAFIDRCVENAYKSTAKPPKPKTKKVAS